jgi:integrase
MDYPKPIKRPGTKVLYFFYTDPITGKRHQKSTGETGPRKARKVIEDFIDDLYDLRIHQPKPLRAYLDMFADPETNPKYREALITDAHYTLGHAQGVGRIMKQIRDEVLTGTSYLTRNMADFTSADIKKIAQMIVNNYGQSRKSQNVYIQLKGLFNYAADNHEIPYSPAAKLRNIKYEEQSREALSLVALKLIVERPDLHQSDKAYAFIAFAALTGLRRGELIALHSSQFSQDGHLLINQALDAAAGDLKETKTYNDRRIPLAKAARDIIEPYLENEIVFNNQGKMVHTRSVAVWYSGFRSAVVADKDIPLEIKEAISKSTLHALRHSLATLLRFSGIHDSVVRAYMGWELGGNKDMLERYTHVTDYLKGCADMIDSLFSGKIIPIAAGKSQSVTG